MLNLTDRERVILRAVEHQAETPIAVVAKQIGVKEHAVRYSFESLIARGLIVSKAPFINLYPLGYTDHTLFFSLSSADELVRERFLKGVEKSPMVSWMAKIGGEFQYAVAFCSRHLDEVVKTLQNISEKFGNPFFEKALSLRVKFVAYGRKYLSTAKQFPTYSFGSTGNLTSIDEIDHQILSDLSDNGVRRHREISRAIGIPLSTLGRRLARLEHEKVIAGYIHRLNLSTLGISTYRLFVYSRGYSRSLTAKLESFCAAHPHIIHFVHCVGPWDFEIGVEVLNAENVTQIVSMLYDKFGGDIEAIKMTQLFRHLKFSSYPLSKGPERP